MFKGIFNSNETFICLLKSIEKLLDDVKIEITSNGWKINQFDNANVILYHCFIDKKAFSIYENSNELFISIHIKSLYNSLKNIQKDDIIHVSIDNDKLIVKLVNTKRSLLNELSLMNIDSDIISIPDRDCTGYVILDPKLMKEAIYYKDFIDCTIQLDSSNISFTVNNEIDKFTTSIHKSTKTLITTHETLSQSFSSKLLLNALSICSYFDYVTLYFYDFENCYILIEYLIEDYLSIRYYISPKI